MQVTPKAEKDMSGGFDNLPPGVYPFTVLESSVAISKSEKNAGKEMVKLKLDVHGKDYSRHVYDQFADWFSEWKLKHFCETAGMAKEYLRGNISPEDNAWAGRQGYCKIRIVPAGKYPEKNEVSDYCPDDDQTCEVVVAAKPTKPADDQGQHDAADDFPF